jgi:hypothetical protein
MKSRRDSSALLAFTPIDLAAGERHIVVFDLE